ncbi:MAG TPA: cell wall-binding repeat-containing protein [Nitriliruptorales bacterium]
MPFRLRLAVIVVLALAATACSPSSDASATAGEESFPQPSPAPTVTDAPGVHHVAIDGSDGAAGTADAPWRSIAVALERLEPGDTLIVHGGTYRERVRDPRTAPATEDAPILVTAAAGERPVIQGLLWLRGIDHWTLDGIHVTWDDATGGADEHMVKVTDGTGWQLRNAEIWGARSFAAVLVASSGGQEPRDWRITGSCIHDTHASNGTNQDHLIYVNSGLASGPGLIDGNLLFGASNGNGVKLGGPNASSGGAAHVMLRHNTIHGTAQNVLIAYDASGNVLEGNVLSEVGEGYGNVRGYRLEGEGNVARGNAGWGASSLLNNDEGYVGVADGGGNVFPLDPEFDATDGCSGFVPSNEEAAPYGHLASRVAPAAEDVEPVVGPTYARAAGPDRVATAVAVARSGWADSQDAVLARSDDPADALAGAALAGALDAPLLITPGDHLAPEVADVLEGLSVRRVVLLGGPAALGATVPAALADLGIAVDRIAGATREQTAVRIAERLGPIDRALLIRGRMTGTPDRAWPDALAVSGVAARLASQGTPAPVLLVGDQVGATTAQALVDLGVTEVVLVGGTAVLPDTIDLGLRAAGYEVQRWSGPDRYATSRQVNDAVGVGGVLIVATGQAFPDGLAAGALAARLGGTLVLSPVTEEPAMLDWVAGHAEALAGVLVVGGEAAVPEATAQAYADATS